MATCTRTSPNQDTITDDSAHQDDQQPYAAPIAFTLQLTEREAAYIRWRMYQAKQENGGKARKRATAIHAALKAAGVPA